jgi:cobalt/nickel transport system ATP-binding protein
MNQNIAAIEVANLDFAYPDGHEALHGINLTVPQGERVGLVGPNGAGKSTLMLHLNGILTGEGDVRIHGLAVEEENLRRIRSMVGLVFQDPDDQLFSPTVFDDVAFGPIYMGLSPDEIHRRVEHSLTQVSMQAYSRRTSHHLSVGEKKRIAIATVLSMDSRILALDEPSAGLDPRARGKLIGLLRSLPQTQLISSHDLRLIQSLCSRTLILDRGQIVADGPTSELLSDQELLAKYCLSEDVECLDGAQAPAPHA